MRDSLTHLAPSWSKQAPHFTEFIPYSTFTVLGTAMSRRVSSWTRRIEVQRCKMQHLVTGSYNYGFQLPT